MRLIDADSLKEDLRQYYPDEVLDGVTAKATFSQIMHDIDNAPTATKDNRPNACFNCEHCCYFSVNSDGEIKIMCNLGKGDCDVNDQEIC